MSLLQGYSSAEEDEEQNGEDNQIQHQFSSDDEVQPSAAVNRYDSAAFQFPKPSHNESTLPSAFDAFSQVAGPPQFLNNSVEEQPPSREVEGRGRHGRWRDRKERKDLPAGAVVESKANLVGLHERVRSDIGDSKPPSTSASSTVQDGAKRVVSAANPNAEDAAELLRMCLQCGIPKTFSNARGMVCPVCSDRPPAETPDSKKKGSTVKDKEKSKRMRGQSSHASWKSETEMHLRQQFD